MTTPAPRDPAAIMEALLHSLPALITSVLVSGFLFGMFVYAAVLYFRRLRHNWKTRWLAGIYVGAALPAAVIGAGMSAMAIIESRHLADQQMAAFRPIVVVAVIAGGLFAMISETFKGLVYTGAGEWFAVKLRQPSFPFLRGWLRERRRRRGAAGAVASTLRFPWRWALLASGAVVGYTALLFWLTGPRVTPLLKVAFPGLNGISSGFGTKVLVAWVVVLLAVKEEVVFRLFLQGAFERWLRSSARGGLWAVLLSAAVWTLAHAGMVEPAWVKYAQILPIGILLGLMRRRWGIESTILVHVLLNLAAVFLLGDLARP